MITLFFFGLEVGFDVATIADDGMSKLSPSPTVMKGHIVRYRLDPSQLANFRVVRLFCSKDPAHACGAPQFFVVGSRLGYHYAAVHFAPVLLRTLWLIVGLLLLRDVLLRAFTVAERRLRLEAATEAEHVLDDPALSVTFASFGDNSLNLELRSYVPSLDYNLATKTAIHDAIYEKLSEAGITIAFPQRDVHLDVTGPLDVQLWPETPLAPATREPRTKLAE